MYILKTTDKVSNNYYYTIHYGTEAQVLEILDPAKKFKAIDLEDGGKSVVTEIAAKFGMKKAMLDTFAALENTIDLTKLPVEAPKKEWVKPEPVPAPTEPDPVITEPAPIVEKPNKKK